LILYHYTTWRGSATQALGVIHPKTRYGFAAQNKGSWPSLVFLTADPYWEPSIQARTADAAWSKGASDPEEYSKKGIPCFRFEVEFKEPLFKMMYPHPYWLMMLQDAKKLGSDVAKWHWTEEPCIIKATAIWKKEDWHGLHVPTKNSR